MAQPNLYCTFHLDSLLFGVEVEKVQEVVRNQAITHVPLASSVVHGLINLRGRIVTALDMRCRLELPPRPADRTPMNVVVETSDGVVSLLVDDIGEVVEVTEDQFERSPETVHGVARELIRGVYKLAGKLMIVLDLEKTTNVSI